MSNMSFKRKDLVFGATSKRMETQHLELVNSDLKKKQDRINNLQEETKKIKDDARWGDRWDKLEAMEEIARTKSTAKNAQKALKTLGDSPFFSRLDFQEGGSRKDICYISKGNITDLLTSQDNVNYVNWRAPIASLYYKFNGRPMRNVSYNAPRGKIDGDIALVARMKIKDKDLKELFISSNGMVTLSGDYDPSKDFSNVQKTIEDDLQDKLASNSSDRMGEIVETIQSEQDEIIRYDSHQSIIVQGAAGSGKTSIALHRVAYLLYEDMQDNEVLFVSPNKAFTEYISDVLPELGELNIPIKTFDEIYTELFGIDTPNTLYDIIEQYYEKGLNLNTAQLFDEKIDISADNVIRASEEIRNKITDLKDALRRISNDDYIKFQKRDKNKDTNKYELETESDPSVLSSKKLKELITIPSYENVWNANCGYHYKDPNNGKDRTFLPEINKKCYTDYIFYAIVRTIINDKKLYNYTEETNYLKDGRTINKNNPVKRIPHTIKHIVVDEAQDYTKWHMYLLHLLCPNAKFTILGDKNQNINPYLENNTLENILEEVDNMAAYFPIKNAYRSSPEIVEYTNKILGTDIVAKRRSQGVRVEERFMKSVNSISTVDLDNDILKLQESYSRIGIVCRNKDISEFISELIEGMYGNTSVMPVYEAKGLEFDAVIVIDTFDKDREKELLYTACTRAQHKLIVYKIIEERRD